VLRAAEDPDDYSAADATRISTILLDLLELNYELSGESQQRVLYHQTQGFIQRQLADPELTPATIAEAHHISVRTLHRLFGSHGHPVTEWIRTPAFATSRRQEASQCHRLDRESRHDDTGGMTDSAVWVAALTGGTAVLAGWVTSHGNARAARIQAEASARAQDHSRIRE
jgi:hypothetical protein